MNPPEYKNYDVFRLRESIYTNELERYARLRGPPLYHSTAKLEMIGFIPGATMVKIIDSYSFFFTSLRFFFMLSRTFSKVYSSVIFFLIFRYFDISIYNSIF